MQMQGTAVSPFEMATQAEPMNIVSVNNTPQRAKELVAILIDVSIPG